MTFADFPVAAFAWPSSEVRALFGIAFYANGDRKNAIRKELNGIFFANLHHECEFKVFLRFTTWGSDKVARVEVVDNEFFDEHCGDAGGGSVNSG